MANNSSSGTYYVSVEKLQIGLYVFIDLPWFQHPFTLNSFRISSEDQVRTLKSLGESRFRYDPKRSDVDPDDPVEALPAELEATVSDTVGESIGESDDADLSPEFAARRERIRVLDAHRRRIEEVDKTYLKATGILRNLNRKLLDRGDETLQEMDVLVDQMVTAFLKHPEVTLHVMGEKFSGVESYSHSLNVSVLCMMLSKGLGLSSDQAHSLGLGALLHDIGLAEIPERVLKKRPDEYTKPERDLRAMHCEFGVRLGKQLGLPPDILAIIFQHHEMADGSGYPTGARLDKITFPARVVSLVNFYDNLCNPADLAQALTPHEALSFMFGQRRTKFDTAILQQMIRCLGVYPPGSIVTLSNDVVGLVMSVNPTKPLRPWIMAYDADVPKEEAILLNLEQETELVIAKALRPALLPPAIHAYLSPRQRVTYYFDSSVQPSQGTK
ncbi:HD-GYP domain-containing protein [Propionivibrio dicarboxylicus]|uniref:HDIG domain-containing protein n=1 Tax=Propionivibrio dicarboxylicus TaxID=83767 RepID=A0A1G8GY82_9RHOO|nr:HD-GYP domain-containing protein [Propionivibrio dicarboxylicus]SDH99362.1 HDIG domain-containing protein [Propionivibrio dicarboxylicus]